MRIFGWDERDSYMSDAAPRLLVPVNWKNAEFYTRNMMNVVSAAVTSYEKHAPRRLRRFTGFLFLLFASITPAVPVDLRRHSGSNLGWRVFWVSALICFLYDFGMTAAFTYFCGTLYGHDPNVMYFLNDHANLVDYFIICPAYVGASCWIIYLLLSKSKFIAGLADELSGALRHRPAEHAQRGKKGQANSTTWHYVRHHVLFPILVLAFTVGSTWSYIHDILNSSAITRRYWFMSDPGTTAHRHLNMAGYHYVVLNFLLLLVTVIAVMSFFRMFIETVRVGNNIHPESGRLPCRFTDLRRNLSHFTEAYIVAKALCLVYVFNIFTWEFSDLVVAKNNLNVARGMISAMALLFISFPRYFVEYKWQLCRQYATTEDREQFGDATIRSTGQVTMARILDTAIGFWILESTRDSVLNPVWQHFTTWGAYLRHWIHG